MADPRFFNRSGPFTLQKLADISGAKLQDGVDPASEVSDVAPLDKAGAGHITFLDNVRYKDQLSSTQAAACILDPKMAEHAPKGVQLLLSPTPYKSYALIAQAFYPATAGEGSVSKAAHIGAASIDPSATVEAGAVIMDGATIGAGAYICANAVIGKNVGIGAHTRIGANANVSHAMIGEHCNIYPGVCIGQDGFGFAIDPAGHVKVPQLGRVIIGDHVEIGANTTVDRGAGPDTEIGSGTWIDNQVQIAHNVKIGRGCVIIAQAGIAGSTVLEDYVVVAAKVGVAGHLKIGMGARIGAMSGVMRNVAAGEEVLGQPAMPAKEFMRQVATIKRMTSKRDKN